MRGGVGWGGVTLLHSGGWRQVSDRHPVIGKGETGAVGNEARGGVTL